MGAAPAVALTELRDQYGGPSLSDEELLLRYMVPAEDLEATRAAGPLRTDYLFTPPGLGERPHRPLRRAVSAPGACG